MSGFLGRAKNVAIRRVKDLEHRGLYSAANSAGYLVGHADAIAWAVEQLPTEAEILAGAKTITRSLYWSYDEWDDADKEDREQAMDMSCAVLLAAMEARKA